MSVALKILQKHWGYDSFRPLQEEIIQSVLNGHDTLALLPTGGGKSICFQVPGLALNGLCLVVSPLIALMNDQVRQLSKRGIPAIAIHSALARKEIDSELDRAAYSDIKFLYVSPERLKTDMFLARIDKLNVTMLAVDEAHCISQWGYDFRPPYLDIWQIRELLPSIPIIALTATATTNVVQDIQDKLKFRAETSAVYQKSFTRSNLSYSVLYEEDKKKSLLRILNKVPGSGIIYVRSRKRTQQVAELLQQEGFTADFYHAGLTNQLRSEKQQQWIDDEIRIMVCTNAFGMGIDKPDVRTVVHLDLPESPEEYFQEAGRAGRDGQKAYAVLLFNPVDQDDLEQRIRRSFPEIERTREIYHALGNYARLAIGAGKDSFTEFDLRKFCIAFGFKANEVIPAIKLLQDNEYLRANAAVFSGSQIMFTSSQRSLEDMQDRNPKIAAVSKLILRSYEGSFDHFVKISESFMQKKLEMGKEELKALLNLMQQHGIAKYIPAGEQSNIYWTKSRLSQADLVFDMERYNFLKKTKEGKANAMIAYVNQMDNCRSRVLVKYFGEAVAPKCGICDVCTGRNQKPDISTKESKDIKERIVDFLADGPVHIEKISDEFGNAEQKIVLVIREMMDAGQVLLTVDRKLKLPE